MSLISTASHHHSLCPRFRQSYTGVSVPRSLRLARLAADMSNGIIQQTPNIERMSEPITIKVKIGVTFAPREIEIEIEDVDAFVSDFDAAMSSDSRVWWITDSSGRRRGLVADKVSYVDIEPPLDRTVGF